MNKRHLPDKKKKKKEKNEEKKKKENLRTATPSIKEKTIQGTCNLPRKKIN